MNPISFITANYVARQVGYHMTDWGQAQKATEAYFRPVDTFEERFDQILDDICRMGFTSIDIWLGHLHPAWATDRHIRVARHLLEQRGLNVVAIAGGFGSTPDQFETYCRLASAMGVRVLGGVTSLVDLGTAPDIRAAVISLLEQYDLLLAIENHPEKKPAEVLAKIGTDGRGRIGTCVDTGIWGSQGYDAAQAVQELAPHIFHVHLKDVLHAGAHESCRFGRGVVPLEKCVRLLQEQGYTGSISIEHEPHDFDPTEDVAASLSVLRGWMNA